MADARRHRSTSTSTGSSTRIEPLPDFPQPLLEALGLPSAEDVVAPIDLPSFDNSAMDGYAVRLADVVGATEDAPVHLPVVGEIGAGQAQLLAHVARHGGQDHDRRPDADRRRRGGPLRVDRPGRGPGPDRPGAHGRASTSGAPARTSRSATC